MNNIASILSTFLPVSLEEMDHVKLLDRIDSKYVMNISQLPVYLTSLKEQYSLLVIEGKSVHPYETLYYDTPGFRLYQMHHNGLRNRYKLRCRKYVNSGISYFEIKSKTNTGRTIKKRISIDSIPEMLNEPLKQYIVKHISGAYKEYIPALRVFFDRITLVNNTANERLTIDTNLRYKVEGFEKGIHGIVIVEVKQEKHSISPFRELMKVHRQPRNYLSKYCLGIICLNNGQKKNRFKQKINALNKLGYDLL